MSVLPLDSVLSNRSDLNMTRRLTNQDAFDVAILHLLNQGHSCLSSSGQARYRGRHGKSAIGALIPDSLYVTSMEGKKLHHWLAAPGPEYGALRERLGGVTPSLLDDLQDLHDRSGACMPSLYRHLVVAGAQPIAQSFKLSMRLVHRCATYQHIRGPQIFAATGTGTRPIPAAAPAIAAPSAPAIAAPSAPAFAAPSAPAIVAPSAPAFVAPSAPAFVAPSAPAFAAPPAPTFVAPPAPAIDVPPAPEVTAAAPTPAPEPTQLTARPHPQEELDLIARGIAKAIAAASAPSLDRQSGRR
jgi:hypothetical protein